MAIKNITESPTIADQIIFDLITTNSNGCVSDPFKIVRAVIYYAERDFVSSKFNEFENQTGSINFQAALAAAKQAACLAPTEENLLALSKIEQEIEINTQKNTFYYNNAKPVAIFGTEDNPAWLSTDTENAILERTSEGHFKLEWTPTGMREGDYFICWEWKPELVAEMLATNVHFNLAGSTQLTTSIPTHFTKENKYEILLNRYLPEMFKERISSSDVTPEVLQEFNNAVAKGFVVLEDLANQMVDVIDANATHENFLPFLANLFNLRLKSTDPTSWRRQIKRAIPIFKKKGTLRGLVEAFDQIGIKMNKYTKLWQIISPYTWQEIFNITGIESQFILSKQMVLPLDEENFELSYRAIDSDEWTILPNSYVFFENIGDQTIMNFLGISGSGEEPFELNEGDTLKVLYKIVEVPTDDEQTLENYIRNLPLSDLRDEREQECPLKNWNVRVIEEDDPLFDVLISVRHPFAEPVIYGHVRTEFPYSENVYNMEEYNGSIRESTSPCDIDCDFIDECQKCLSSKYNVDLEIDNLSTDRLQESIEVLEEYMPFHAQLHSINFSGSITEFINPPVENIECLIKYECEDVTVTGGQLIFNRVLEDPSIAKRDMLADFETVDSGSATALNLKIVMFAPDINFDRLGLNLQENLLEITSPDLECTVSEIDGHYATVPEITDGFSESPFTFRLSNVLIESNVGITQDDYFTFADESIDFVTLGVKSSWDATNDDSYSGGSWVVSIPSYSSTFEILTVLPNGILVLSDPDRLLPTSNQEDISYSLLNDNDQVIATSVSGSLKVARRGRVDISASLDDASGLIKIGNYFLYDGNQYKVIGFSDLVQTDFFIEDYDDGDASGVASMVLHRLIDGQVGQFYYKGLSLSTSSNLEIDLGIQNGANPPINENPPSEQETPPDAQLENNTFKENFLILIDSDYYAISNIDGSSITLSGPHNDWTLAGTSVSYSVLKFTKLSIEIPERTRHPALPGHYFDFIDRRGSDVIESETGLTMTALNAAKGNQIEDVVTASENISFEIEYLDGTKEQGEI